MSSTSDAAAGSFPPDPHDPADPPGGAGWTSRTGPPEPLDPSEQVSTAGPPPPALVPPARAEQLRAASVDWPSVTLDPFQLADLELLLLGVFGPAPGYPGHGEADDPPMPALIVDAEVAASLEAGTTVALRDREGVMLAALTLRAVEPVPGEDGPAGDGTPARVRLVGTIEGVELPHHPDYPELRLTPTQVWEELTARGWTAPGATPPWAVWADGLLHTADVSRIRAITRQGKHCVILAPVGGADPADANHHLRIRCLLAALDAIDAQPRPAEATLAGEPIASDAVSKEGARHHTEFPPDPLRARAPRRHRSLLVLVPVAPSPQLAVPREPGMSATSPQGAPVSAGTGGRAMDETAALISLRAHLAQAYGCSGSLTGPAIGTPSPEELMSLLDAGSPIPAELTPPAVAAELTRAIPPRSRRGLTVFFTGLSGSGKSTLAGLLACRLLERGRRVTLLDGDVVRTHLSRGLGFSRADRETNVRRIGFVAAEVAAAGGTAVCAPIAPYASVRAEARQMTLARGGGFVLVHVSTPLEECERRDRKGLYAKARAGVLPAFTGISDPYEEPADAEVVVDTSQLSPDEAVGRILDYLRAEGWVTS
mgnify:CR=1 FL=1